MPAPVAAAEPELPTITSSAPGYDSPGALVGIIVTVTHPPAGYAAELSISGTDGATATCLGATWYNPLRDTLSRSCYLELPLVPGDYHIALAATFSRAGQPDIVLGAERVKPIKAGGMPSPTPMTVERALTIERCGNTTDHVWLTFDDSTNPAKVKQLLAVLRANNVRARFFFTGKAVARHPYTVRRVRRAGHLVGNHTWSHAALTKASDEVVLREIDRGQRASTSPPLLRPPYGAGAFSTRLADLAASRGYALCHWTVDTNDWRDESAELIVERVRHGDFRTPPVAAGGVVLMHCHGDYTALALQGVIDAVRARGLTLEPLR